MTWQLTVDVERGRKLIEDGVDPSTLGPYLTRAYVAAVEAERFNAVCDKLRRLAAAEQEAEPPVVK